MLGGFAKAKAGHDKGEVYIIFKENEEYVYLVNGKNKTAEHPKKKRCKHIQPILKYVDVEIMELLQKEQPIQNELIKRAIKNYQKV